MLTPYLLFNQVSLSLQDRLGLAKVKYQNGRLHGFLGSDRPFDSSSEVSRNSYDTLMPSSPPFHPSASKELPRSAHNKHAATFNSRIMEPMLSGTRKRLRTASFLSEPPPKVSRLSWKSSHQLPESSPTFSRHQPMPWPNSDLPLMSDATTVPEASSLPSDDEVQDDDDAGDDEPDLPAHSFQDLSSSTMRSSPPQTPPRKPALRSGEKVLPSNDDGADLLLFLANSPTPARVYGRGHQTTSSGDFVPSTPPSRHTGLPSLTPTPGGGVFPNFSTPNNQPFNFSDFVNVTPSPAQNAWGGRTPGGPPRTPLAAKSTRKMLNFDNLAPPGMDHSKTRDKEDGLALKLGEELRP